VSALPAWLVPVGGASPWPPQLPPGTAVLAARLDLDLLLRRAARPPAPIVVDVDDVAGLAPDRAAVRFLTRRLGVAGVVTRHALAAVAAAEHGIHVFFRVSALDSTGLERALAAHPRAGGLGTAVSPGLVLPHLAPDQREALPGPILAYGLISTVEDAAACLQAGAACVVRPLTNGADSVYIRAERDGTVKERSPASAQR
jgi:glycerol-3-phosphate responsive antiterminator